MGLKVTKDMSVFEGKTLTGYSFSEGNEQILYLEDKDGNTERVRISAALRDLLNSYYEMN